MLNSRVLKKWKGLLISHWTKKDSSMTQLTMFLLQTKSSRSPLILPNPFSLILNSLPPSSCDTRSGVLFHVDLFNLRCIHIKQGQLCQEIILLILGIKILLWSSFSDECMVPFAYFTLVYISRFINKSSFFILIF